MKLIKRILLFLGLVIIEIGGLGYLLFLWMKNPFTIIRWLGFVILGGLIIGVIGGILYLLFVWLRFIWQYVKRKIK